MYTGDRMKKRKEKWNRKRLMALGLPAVLIPGILTAILLGWNPIQLVKVKEYYAVKTLFPKTGVVWEVSDGDTFTLRNGVEVRLIGINAPDRGDPHFDEARRQLASSIDNHRVYLEYDRYQDDKYGRALAWVWVDCEEEPAFLPADYMHLTYNSSRAGLTENPTGCEEGELVNEEMVNEGMAEATAYKDRGELKYGKRIEAGAH